MKKVVMCFLTGMFFMFLFSNSFAQTVSGTANTSQTNTVEQKTADIVAEMINVATLTTEQVEKITPFVTAFFKQKDLDQGQYKGNAESLNTAANKRKETLVQNLKTVLSDDQITKLKEYFNKKSNTGTGNTENSDK